MTRKKFLMVPLGAMLFPWLGSTKASLPESEFGLGKYKSHRLEFNTGRNFNEEQYELGIKYVSFPIENRLTIEYDRGRETYISFNAPKQTIKKINEMSGTDLMRYRISDVKEVAKNLDAIFDVDGCKFRLEAVVLNRV